MICCCLFVCTFSWVGAVSCGSTVAKGNSRDNKMTTRRGSLVGRNIMSLCAIICLVGILLPDSSLAAPNVAHRPLTKRSFHEIQCKGTFDKSIFAKLDRICQDCYDLYRDPDLYGLCRYFVLFFSLPIC